MLMSVVGDTVVRELDFSKITIRLMEHVDNKGDGDEEHVIAKLTGNTIETLRRCLVCFYFHFFRDYANTM